MRWWRISFSAAQGRLIEEGKAGSGRIWKNEEKPALPLFFKDLDLFRDFSLKPDKICLAKNV
jgi:hypothetical protein